MEKCYSGLYSGKDSGKEILCKINVSIVLYGSVHPHRMLSFIAQRNKQINHLTRISMLKNYRIFKRSGRANVTFDFKTSG